MTHQTFSQYLTESTIQYHSHLNKKFWEGGKLKKPINDKLIEIAKKFIEFLDLPEFKVVDYIFTGSAANYNYTQYSDVDLHIILEKPKKLPKGFDLADILDTKKKLWNEEHHIVIHGYPVELYSQLTGEVLTASGVWSVMHNKWNVEPSFQKDLKVEEYAIDLKAKELKKVIDALLKEKSNDIEAIKHLIEKIKDMRKAGLKKAGEFSIENLVFKELRNTGYIDKLQKAKDNAFDAELSIK